MWYDVVCKTVMSSCMSSGSSLGGGRDTVSYLDITAISLQGLEVGVGLLKSWMGSPFLSFHVFFCFYYETIKRELKRRPTYEYRCDERLNAKSEGSMSSIELGYSILAVM